MIGGSFCLFYDLFLHALSYYSCVFDPLRTENLAFLYRNSHIPASLSPASFATATVLVRRKGEMRYVTVFLSSEGKVLFEGLEEIFEDRAWMGLGKKVAQVVDGVLGGYESVK